jgi:ubiquinone biosynthesis protein COQ9
VKSTFDGTYTASTLIQIEGTAKELEALTAKVNRSMEKIRQVKEKREETASAARAERIQKLIG